MECTKFLYSLQQLFYCNLTFSGYIGVKCKIYKQRLQMKAGKFGKLALWGIVLTPFRFPVKRNLLKSL